MRFVWNHTYVVVRTALPHTALACVGSVHQPLHHPHNPRVQLAERSVRVRVAHAQRPEGGPQLAQGPLVVGVQYADDAGQRDIDQPDPEMVCEQADRHQQDDVPYREGGEGADAVLERGVHHRVLDLAGEPLRDEVRQEIVEVAEQENRQRDQQQDDAEDQLRPGNPAVDDPMMQTGLLQ